MVLLSEQMILPWSLKFQALKDQFSAKTQGSFPAAHKEPPSTPYCTPPTFESIPFLQATVSTLGHCSLMYQLQPELCALSPPATQPTLYGSHLQSLCNETTCVRF